MRHFLYGGHYAILARPLGIIDLVEGEAARPLPTTCLFATAEPGVDPTVPPAATLIGAGDDGASSRHLLLVDEVGLARFFVQAETEDGATRFDGRGRQAGEQARQGCSLRADLASGAGGGYGDEGDPVRRHAGAEAIADLRPSVERWRWGCGVRLRQEVALQVGSRFEANYAAAGYAGDNVFDAPHHVGHLVAGQHHSLQRRALEQAGRGGRQEEAPVAAAVGGGEVIQAPALPCAVGTRHGRADESTHAKDV